MPLPEWEKSSSYFRLSELLYDAERDIYICPEGQTLSPGWVDDQGERIQYHAPSAICAACPVRDHCTSHQRGRLIYRSFHANYLERVRGYHATAAFQKAMRKRSVWVEPLFAEAKQWHGLTKFRLRGLANVNIQGLDDRNGTESEAMADDARLGTSLWTGRGPPYLRSRPRACSSPHRVTGSLH